MLYYRRLCARTAKRCRQCAAAAAARTAVVVETMLVMMVDGGGGVVSATATLEFTGVWNMYWAPKRAGTNKLCRARQDRTEPIRCAPACTTHTTHTWRRRRRREYTTGDYSCQNVPTCVLCALACVILACAHVGLSCKDLRPPYSV